MQNPLGEFSQSCPEVQAPRIGGKQQVESYCLRARASKLAFWVLGRDRVRKLLLLWTHEKRRQELPKYHQDLDQIVAAVHIQRSNKQTKTKKKQPSRAHPSMFFDVSKGCGKALPGKAFVRRMQNYCQVFFSTWSCFSWVETEAAADLYIDMWACFNSSTRDSNMLHWDGVDKAELPQCRANAPRPALLDTPLVGPSNARKPYHNFSSLQFGQPTSS